MLLQMASFRGLCRLALAVALSAWGSAAAVAQVTPAAGYTPPDDTPSVKVGITLFADYTYTDEPTATDKDGNTIHQNSFNVSRTYINVTGNINHLLAFRITPDITRETLSTTTSTDVKLSDDGSLVFRLKYGFGQINLDDWLTKGSWLRLGVNQTPFIDWEEAIYRYRFQGTMFVDREGFLNPSDLGFSAHVNFPADYGDVHLGVYNGETFTKPEANDQKAFQIRATLHPAPAVPILKGLRLTGFYVGDHYIQGAKRERFVANPTFEHPYVTAGLEYLDAKDQTSIAKPEVHAQGFSVWATPRTPIGIEALLRYEELKPDKDNAAGTSLAGTVAKKKRTILGLAYWLPVAAFQWPSWWRGSGGTVALLADYEKVDYDNYASAKPTEKRYALHTLFNF